MLISGEKVHRLKKCQIESIIYKQSEIQNAQHRIPKDTHQTRSTKRKYDDIEKTSAITKIKDAIQQAKKSLTGKIDNQLYKQIFNEIDTFIVEEEQKEEPSRKTYWTS